uniref:Uncharacterized protein n=1 Tax=Chlamydomonas euryale TaxID=1486919 RepID=A0A6U2HD71_9CHLO|mmetsp:Transcript_38542/g.114425  ORF Transcript_38542/g.114425 Transcript_38542/m.114425 type:complete len:659 (+) Transcript_38542:454-2430(+)
MKESMAFYNETWDGPKTFQQLEDHHAGSHEGIGWAWDNVIGPRTFGSALWTNGSFTNTTFLTDGIKQKLAGDPVVGGLATGKVWYTGAFYQLPHACCLDLIQQRSDSIVYAHIAAYTTNKGEPGVGTACNFMKMRHPFAIVCAVMKPEVPGTPRGDHVAFVYGYFFPWNGCSNQLLSVIIDDKFYGAEYYKCASDVHEGDLEHTKSLACTQDLIELLDSPDPRVNATSLVRRVQMSQHSWIQELDCEKDECPAETGDDGITRLIAYSALHSHAVYPKASPLQVYRAAQANAVTSGGGLYIADRTSADGPVFVPNTTNTQRVPYAAQMNDTERAYFSWALYPGGIGSNDMIKGANSSIVCLYGNITSVGPCPSSNPAVHFIVKALELSGDYVQHNKDVVYMFDGDVDAEVPLQGMTSLLFRTFAYKWPIGGSQAPVVGTNTSCPFTVRLTLSEVTYDVTSSTNLGAFIGTILGLMVGFGIVYTIMLFFPGIEDRDLTINIPNLEKSMDSGAGKLTADPGYSFSKTTLPCESAINGKSKPVFFVQRSLLWLGTAVILYIAGLTMCVVGFYDLFQVCPASLQIHINGLCLSHPASLAPCFPPALASLLPCVPPVLPPLSSVSFLPLVPLPSLAGCASCTSHPACSVASHGVTWHSLLDAER